MPENIFISILLWPLLLYSTLIAILLAAILGLSYILGQQHRDRDQREAAGRRLFRRCGRRAAWFRLGSRSRHARPEWPEAGRIHRTHRARQRHQR